MATAGKRDDSFNIPEGIRVKLAAEDARQGFPAGTMQSVMQQEGGGRIGEFLQDPRAYHYPLNAEGQRIAASTGKVSTAFGPFGLLESTAAKPGYGVQPLQNPTFDEQLRFASDYLGARVKQAGGLSAGLAGYGMGPQYANEVLARVGQRGTPVPPAPVVAQVPAPMAIPEGPPERVGPQPPPVLAQPLSIQDSTQLATAAGYTADAPSDPWAKFNQELQKKAQVSPQDLDYGRLQRQVPRELVVPDFMAMAQYATAKGAQGPRALASFGDLEDPRARRRRRLRAEEPV